jgi:ligand-binding sensor domain-containing protein
MRRIPSIFPAIVMLLSIRPGLADQWMHYTTIDGLADDRVNAIAVDPNGSVWFGTDNGLSRFNGYAWTSYRADPSKIRTLASNRIFDIACETADGQELWIGTDGGVSVMGIETDGVTFATPYTSANRPLVSDCVRAVMVDSGRVKWFGTDLGISLFNGAEWDTVDRLDLASMRILNFGVDKTTGWNYVGTRGGGVSRLRLDSWDAITSASPYEHEWANLPTDTITASFIEENGWQWFGTGAGLCLHQETETKQGWTFYAEDSGLADPRVESIVRDRSGRLWVGTQSGVSTLGGGRWGNEAPVEGPVRDIAESPDGSIWFATGRGVWRYTAGTAVGNRNAGTAPEFRLMPNFPNPFNPVTMLGFSLGESAAVKVEVYSCSGRRIAVLADRRFAAGVHRLEWNAGLEGEGTAAPSGVYLAAVRVRCAAFTGSFVQKITLVK